MGRRSQGKDQGMRNPTLAILMVALFVVSGLASVGLATHANELLPNLRDLLGGDPSTGQPAADNAAEDVFDEYETLRAEPQVPANYFYSSAGEDLRIGGHGDWKFLLADSQRIFREPGPSQDWQETSAYPAVGDYGFSFGNGVNGQYRPETVNAFYVSPAIDLSVFVVTTGNENVGTLDPASAGSAGVQAGQNAALGASLTQAEQIKLRFVHKFNLAFQNDGARVEVFTTKPKAGDLSTPAAVLQPSLHDVSTATMRPTNAYNGPSEPTRNAFTGQQGEWQTAEFDLTAFAGQEIYLGLRVATQISAAERERYFDLATYFPPSNPLPFFGWKVDAVQVEGPAHLSNLRIREIQTPFYTDSKTGDVLAPAGAGPLRGDRSVFRVQVENRGSVTEEGYRVAFTVTGPAGVVACDNGGASGGPRLRPGGHAVVTMGCAPLGDSLEYTLRTTITSGDDVPDGDPQDNSKMLSFRARTVLRLPLQAPLGVHPAIGEPQDVRTVDVHVRNDGNDDALVTLRLQVLDSQGQPANVPAFDQPPADVPVPIGEGLEYSWTLLLPSPGVYALRVTLTANGENLFQQTLRASTMVGSGDVFFDDHIGPPQGNFLGDGEWETQGRWTPDPAGATDGVYWELAADDDRNRARLSGHQGLVGLDIQESSRTAALTGHATSASDFATRSYSEIVVTVRHQLNARCGGGWSGVGNGDPVCRNPAQPRSVGTQPDSSIGSYPFGTDTGMFPDYKEGLASHELWLTAGQTKIDASLEPRALVALQTERNMTIEPVSILLDKVRSIGPSRDEARFHSMQWIESEYRVLPSDIDPRLDVIPGGLLPHLTFEARIDYGPCYMQRVQGGSSSFLGVSSFYRTVDSPHNGCPHWWIDQIAVEAVESAEAATKTLVMRTSGEVNNEVGRWVSSVNPTVPRYAEGTVQPLHIEEASCAFTDDALTPNTDSEDLANACPVWVRREAQPAPPSEWRIHDESVLTGAPAWWVGPEKVNLSIDYQYPQQSIDVLVSPTMEVPSGLDDASLKFFHKFRLRTPTDYGGVFIQFMSDGDPEPISPFYQLVLQDGVFGRNAPQFPNRAAQNPQSQVFVGDSCNWYMAAGVECDPNLALRGMHLESIPLEPIRYLNYSAINERTANLSSEWVTPNQHIQDIDSWRYDVLAYEHGSKSLKETGGRVRFAFVHYSNERNPTPGVADGWFVGQVLVTGDSTPAHDVSIDSLMLDVPYHAEAVGLGPGTQVEFVAAVTNSGLFSQPKVGFEAVLTNADDQTSYTTQISTPDGFVLKPMETIDDLRIPVDVPDTPGAYHVMVRAFLPGREDNFPANNCRDFDLINLQSGSNENCNPQKAPPSAVRRHVDVGIDASIVPLAGRIDDPARGIFFPRTTFVTVTNNGNVPVEALDVKRAVQKIVPPNTLLPAGTRIWNLPQAIEPGEALPFDEATRTLISGNPNDDDLTLSFDEAARYLVGFEVGHPEDANIVDNRQLILLEAWEVFYSNNFEPGGEDRSLFVHGEWASGGEQGEAWEDTSARSFVDSFGRGRTSYWFGDAGDGRYPANASAWLEMPKMDLSNSSLAFLNFRTNYDFEFMYDGGLVEASTDDGDTWFPLRPDPLPPFLPDGYPSSLASSNPLNVASDPTQTIDAYTGDSAGIIAGTDWIPVTIDLGRRIEDFRNALVVESFAQKGFVDEATGVDPDRKIRTHHTWTVDRQDCPKCWQVENVAKGSPSLLDDDGSLLFDGQTEFWWSGLRRPGTQNLRLDLSQPDARFPPDVDVGSVQIWLTWWQNGQGSAPNLQPVERLGDWVRIETEITVRYRDAATSVEQFLWSVGANAGSIRGWGITNPALQAYAISGGGHRTLVAEHALDIGNDAIWVANGWTRETGLDAPEVWSVATETTHLQTLEPVWTFRGRTTEQNPFHPTVPYADERLVTPEIDLTSVTGSQADLTYWTKGFAPAGDIQRVIEVQVLDRFAVPPRWGDWQQLTATNANFNQEEWTQVGPIALGDDFIGQKIRLGFRGISNQDTIAGSPQRFYNGWWIDDVQVRAETMVGGPLRVRFHAGTDASVSSAGWGIDNVEVVGRSYTQEGGNVAIILDDATDRNVAPGETLWINGTVRNLSPKIWVNLGIQGLADLPDGAHALEGIKPEGLIHPDVDGLIGGFTLLQGGQVGSDGAQTDRLPFSFRFDVPENVMIDGEPETIAGKDLKVRIEVGHITGTDFVSIRDENLGDHSAQFDVFARTNELLEVESVDLDLRDPAVGETTTIRVGLHNSGTLPSTSNMGLFIRNVTSQDEVVLPAVFLDPAPGHTAHAQWEWTPDVPGVYAIEYTNGASYLGEGVEPDRELAAYAFVNQSLNYFYDSLDELSQIPIYDFDPTMWSREAGPPVVQACGRSLQTAGLTRWGPADRAVIGSRSLVTAADDTEFNEGQTYPSNMDDRLYQPLVNLDHLVDTGRSGNPPILDGVFLNFWFRPLAEPGSDGLAVTARVWNPGTGSFGAEFDLEPEDDALWEQAPCDNPVRSISTNMLTGQQDHWIRANFDLGQRNGLLGSQVQPTYRFGSNTGGNLQGVFIDSVSISGYNARTEPATQNFLLTDDATKDFHVRITNEAPVSDTFRIEIDPAATNLPPHVGHVEVLTPELDLAPGESDLAHVRVTTPLDRNLTTAGPFNIAVLAVSLGDPNRAAVANINFDVFAPRLWPDLDASLRVGSDDGAGSEGEPLSYLATVSNFGLATADPSGYVLFACRVDQEEEGACVRTSDNVIDEGTLPEIRSFIQTGRTDLSRAVVTGSWTPPVGGAGDYRLVLVADPAHAAADYDRKNNRYELPITIHELMLPDLRIDPDSFRIETSSGQETDRALQGQLVRIRATVENVGNAPAPNVKLRINTQFTLNSQQIARLDPGDRVEVVATWVTLPGTWIIKAEATTSKPEFDLANNALSKKLVVERSDFLMDVAGGEVRGQPGDSWEFPLTVTNTGDAPIEVNVQARAPAGFRPEVVPGHLTLDILETGEATVRVISDDAVAPGRYQIVVQAATIGVDLPPASAVHTVVIESLDLAAVAQDAFVGTGDAQTTATIPVVNRGSSPLTARAFVDAPSGWRVAAQPPRLALAPGETGNFSLDIDVPRDFRPGEYAVTVTIHLPTGPQETTVSVVVPATTSFDAAVLRNAMTEPGVRTLLLRVENVGNVAGLPRLLLTSGDSTSHIAVEPPITVLEPGAASLHTVTIRGADTPPVHAVQFDGRPLEAAPAGTPATTPSPRRGLDLQVADVTVSPRRDIRPGTLVTVSATLANEGDTTAPTVPAVLYVDGVLVAHQTIDPTAGFSARADFQWRATGGIHVMMVVLDPFEETHEDHRSNNVGMATIATVSDSPAQPAFVIPGLDGIALLAVLAAAAMISGRRRRHES